MIIKRNFWQNEWKIFSERRSIFLQVSEKYTEQVAEKTEEKSEFSKKDYEEVWEKIFWDSEKTKQILEKNFQKTLDRLLNNTDLNEWILNLREKSFDWKNIYTEFSDRIWSLKNITLSKIWILSDWNNKEYNRLVFQEKQIQLTIENLNKVKEQKIHSLEKSQNALKALNEMKWFFWKTGDFLKNPIDWTFWKIWDKWDDRNAKKEVEKLDKIWEKLDEKLNKVVSKKEEIEWRFEQKMWKVDNLAENISWVLEWFDLSEEENEYFIKWLKEWKIDFSFWKLKLERWHEKWKLNKIVDKINLNEISSDLSRKVLEKSIKEFNKKNIDQFKNFSKTKWKMEYFENNKDEFENISQNTKKFEEFDKKENWEILKDLKFEMDWKKFEWNFEINKTKNWEIFFVETNKEWNLDSSCEWWKDLVVVFDKEKWFVEVNDEFLKQKENKEVSEKISEKLEEIKDSFEKIIWENLKDKNKREEFLEWYKNFASKYKEVFKEFKNFDVVIKKYEKVESKKDIKTKEEKIKEVQEKIAKDLWIDSDSLKEVNNKNYTKKSSWNNYDFKNTWFFWENNAS